MRVKALIPVLRFLSPRTLRPALPLSNVCDLNNLGGKEEREERAFASVQIVQEETSTKPSNRFVIFRHSSATD